MCAQSKRLLEQAQQEEASFEVEPLAGVPSYTPQVKAYLVGRGGADMDKQQWIKHAASRPPLTKKRLNTV